MTIRSDFTEDECARFVRAPLVARIATQSTPNTAPAAWRPPGRWSATAAVSSRLERGRGVVLDATKPIAGASASTWRRHALPDSSPSVRCEDAFAYYGPPSPRTAALE